MVKLDVVIVTYNRIEKLKKTLSHYHNQTANFRSLIVVDNHSTDGSNFFLEEWKKLPANYDKYVLELDENKGGSGGFYEGQKFAMSLEPDWVYVADDDAYPDKNMINYFYEYIDSSLYKNESAVCAKVLNADGSIAYEHRSRIDCKYNLKFKTINSQDEDYRKMSFSIDLLSFVGSFLNARALKNVGLVNPSYFIYADDGEHGLRLKKCGNIVCVPKIQIIHDSGQNNDRNNEEIVVSWRNYYAIRNLLHLVKKNYFLAAIYLTLSYIKNFVLNNKVASCKRKLYIKAICDAWLNRLGKHKIYRPGWQILQK